MNVSELIALAKVRSHKSQKELAAEMGHKSPHRISRIGTGQLEADASEIVYLATAAQMQPIEVLADIESQRHPELAQIWRATLDKMRAKVTSL